MKKLSAKQASRWAFGLDREQAAILTRILLDERNESERRERNDRSTGRRRGSGRKGT